MELNARPVALASFTLSLMQLQIMVLRDPVVAQTIPELLDGAKLLLEEMGFQTDQDVKEVHELIGFAEKMMLAASR